MADFEDSTAPTWENVVVGHVNLIDAIDRTITYDASDGKHYELDEETATLLLRPRGWHLNDKHVKVEGTEVSGGLLDFGLYFFHNAQRLLDAGSRPYFYLPEDGAPPRGAAVERRARRSPRTRWACRTARSRATVLIETLPAAFQMDEILYELREHSYGLNAGRWDYIFSMIKCFRDREDFVLPDRNDVKMTVPFMKAYTELLVKTCHRRGAFAMGGMAALIPSRKDEEANKRATDAVQARTRSARPRPASTAPGSRTRTSSTSRSRRSTRCSATSPTRSTSSATTSR